MVDRRVKAVGSPNKASREQRLRAAAGCPFTNWFVPGEHHYDLKKEPRYEGLEKRVVID
jgi:hypothetical protein